MSAADKSAQDEQHWDAQIARDAQAGRLDALAAQALARHAQGQTTEL